MHLSSQLENLGQYVGSARKRSKFKNRGIGMPLECASKSQSPKKTARMTINIKYPGGGTAKEMGPRTHWRRTADATNAERNGKSGRDAVSNR